MKHRKIRAEFSEHLDELISDPSDLPITLRPYQNETLIATRNWLQDPKGTPRAHISHATGLGKTYLFAAMIAAAAGMRVLVILPTRPLLVQTARVIAKFTGGMLGHLSSIAHVIDETGETIAVRGLDHSAIVLTTDKSFNMLAPEILKRFNPQIILRDECHWGYSGSAVKAMNLFEHAVIIGFSATPDYLITAERGGYTPVTLENGQTLYGPRDRFAETHFGTLLDKRTVRWGIESGWLAPLAWGRIEFEMSLKGLSIVEGPDGPDYDGSELQRLMGKHWSVMCETIRRLYDDPDYDLPHRQAYAICPSVKAANELAEAVGSLGIPTACVTGSTPDTERDIILQSYLANEIRLVTSVMILREGWNAPNAEVCMMLRPTASRLLYEQTMGRALRLGPEGSHKVALVLDAYFQGATYAPLSAPMIYAKPGDEVPLRDILIDGPGGGAKSGEGTESPYLPKEARPVLIIVEEISSGLLADKEGFAKKDEEIWGILPGLTKRLGIPKHLIKDRIEKANLQCIEGRGRNGQPASFYRLEDVERVCAKLKEKFPEEDRDRILRQQGKEYATTAALSRLLGITDVVLMQRIKKFECASILGKKHRGDPNHYYLIEEVKRICEDLLANYPQTTSPDGTIIIKKVRYGDPTSLSRIIGVSHPSIRSRVARDPSCRSIMARDSLGRPLRFYALEDVQRLCEDIAKVHIAKKGGSLHLKGRDYISASRYARQHGVDKTAFLKKVKSRKIKSVKGRAATGRATQYYEVSALDELLAEEKALPEIKSDGILVKNEEVWIIEARAIERLGVSWHPFQKLKIGVRTIEGMSLGKRLKLLNLRDLEANLKRSR